MSENAQNKTGYLIFNPSSQKYVFRIYDKGKFKDYDLCALDIKIQILDKYVSIFEEERKIDYNERNHYPSE